MESAQYEVVAGMEVVGSDGRRIGSVRSTEKDSFTVDRALALDLHLRYGAIAHVDDDRVTLHVTAEEAPNLGWTKFPGPAPSGPGRPPVGQGMQVATADDQVLGDVAGLEQAAFRVHKPDAPDLEVPYAAVQAVIGARVVLRVSSQQVEFEHWARPSGQ